MIRNSAYILILAVLSLLALGLVMLLSVSAFAPDNQGNTMYFFARQLIWIVLGVGVCITAARWDYHHWIQWAPVFLSVSTILLLACFVPGIGKEVKGAHRWIDFGVVNLQPSEFLKVTLVAFLAWWYGRAGLNLHNVKEAVLKPLGVLIPALGLVVLQPDLGTTALLIAITAILMFVAGVQYRYFLPLPVLGFAGIFTLALFMPERMQRLLAFMDPEAHRLADAYQPWQALIAFGSGGVSGLGLGNSVQKMYYLPEAHTDFIFPIIGEELGMVTTLLVVLAFVLLVLSCGYIFFHAPDTTGLLLGLGATSIVAIQATMNFAVVTSMMPAKGIGLPFISYGGSNMLVCLACVGILLNIHLQANYEQEETDPLLATPRLAT